MTTRKTVKRVKTGAFERRFSLARAGIMAGARYATLTAGTLLAPREERAERRKAILGQQAQELATELGKLKGSVVKIGQMMALFGEHFLPEEVTAALHTLENNTTALEWPAIERHLLLRLGRARMAELEVDPEPLGAASLGQVHRAVRRSDGKQLVLKIQYPGVSDAIDSDLRAVVQLLKLSRLVPITDQFNLWLDEVRAMLRREVDYRLEARTTRDFATLLADDPRFVVPEVVDDYCTDDVLCLSFESGVHISDPSVTSLSQARRDHLGRAIMELCCMEVFRWSRMQTDPNFGNYLLRVGDTPDDDRIVLLDFGAIRDFHDEVLGPGREMIRASYHHDQNRLVAALQALNFLSEQAPPKVLDEFAELCFEAIEALQDPERYPPPPETLTPDLKYRWGDSDLPARVMARAGKNALSRHFDVPPKEFIFLMRKLLGAYTFLHVIRAEVRGNDILEPFLPLKEDSDRALVAQLNAQR